MVMSALKYNYKSPPEMALQMVRPKKLFLYDQVFFYLNCIYTECYSKREFY